MSDFVPLTRNKLPSMPESFFSAINRPSNIEHDSFYVFTLHKCASTLLKRSFSAIGRYNGLSNIDIDGWRFRYNYQYTTNNLKELYGLFLPKGYWYGVFRSLNIEQTSISPFDLTKKSILLVRDPRDMLTSLYFSAYYSHAAPGSTGRKEAELLGDRPEIDTFVLSRAPTFVTRFHAYIDKLLPAGNTKVFRYEDIIFDKKRLFIPALEYLELDFPSKKMDKLIERENVIPDNEDIYKHIRKVAPGDHRNKLKDDTIEKLNDYFDGILDYFEY